MVEEKKRGEEGNKANGAERKKIMAASGEQINIEITTYTNMYYYNIFNLNSNQIIFYNYRVEV